MTLIAGVLVHSLTACHRKHGAQTESMVRNPDAMPSNSPVFYQVNMQERRGVQLGGRPNSCDCGSNSINEAGNLAVSGIVEHLLEHANANFTERVDATARRCN
jgi:hypothetical protein